MNPGTLIAGAKSVSVDAAPSLKAARIGRLLNKVAIMALMVVVLPACPHYNSLGTYREDFIISMQRDVGRSIDDFSYLQTKSSRQLPNGNIENEYWLGPCPVFYEFDPETRIIVDWWFEENDHCIYIAH